jgi:hypothetical protein
LYRIYVVWGTPKFSIWTSDLQIALLPRLGHNELGSGGVVGFRGSFCDLKALELPIRPSPDKRGDVLMGATVTSLLFAVGKAIIGFYLGHSALTSAYGAAASLVIFLIWIYYSAQILLFGPELTHVYALKYGSRLETG